MEIWLHGGITSVSLILCRALHISFVSERHLAATVHQVTCLGRSSSFCVLSKGVMALSQNQAHYSYPLVNYIT